MAQIELIPGGEDEFVVESNKDQYMHLLTESRLHRYDVQIKAMKQGLHETLPWRLLALFQGAELERLVCGTIQVDLDLLKSVADFRGCTLQDDPIKWFFEIMESFSHEDRGKVISFMWGRSRLPLSADDFGDKPRFHIVDDPVDRYGIHTGTHIQALCRSHRPSQLTASFLAAACTSCVRFE